MDSFGEFFHGSERPPPDGLLCDEIEPDLDLIEPGWVNRGKVDMVSGSLRKPSLYPDVFVRTLIVDDQVHFKSIRDVFIDVVEKLQELLVAVPALALRQNLAGGNVQDGEQRRGAVPDVIVRYTFQHIPAPWAKAVGYVPGPASGSSRLKKHHCRIWWIPDTALQCRALSS